MTALRRSAIGARVGDPVWRATALAGAAQIAGLGIGLATPDHPLLAASVCLSGVVVAAFLLVPRAAGAVRRHPAPTIVGLFAILVLAWSVLKQTSFGRYHDFPSFLGVRFVGAFWGLGRAAIVPLALMTLAVTGGLVLIADAMRSRVGGGRGSATAPWQRMTGRPGTANGMPWRAVAGVLLIAWAGFLGIGVAGRYVANNGALQVLLLVLIAGGAAIVIGTPLLIASLTRVDHDQAEQAREDERQRFAAHLHDSVLQTLALVQRQASDPIAVARLARRQEHALRAWMAGEAELTSETLSAALRTVVAGVEDEHGITVELSIIGDRRLDAAGEAVAAAAREALRNAARHAGAAAAVPVFVFAEISASGAEVFVRDEGGGFELDGVPTERRGIRDAIVGRMSAVGGRASVESAPGEGTEVALKIGRLR
jgi:signal transduction histidine kinase